MDKNREDFENWIAPKLIQMPRDVQFRREANGRYVSYGIQADWEIWQNAHTRGYYAGFRAASGEVEQ